MLTLKDSAIPQPLQDIISPPSLLYVRGDTLTELMQQPRVAIVGSRKITSYGKQVTQQIATDLAKRGVVIVSGLAFGVDAIAHKAALAAGGAVIAVLPSGVNSVYPSSHQNLAEEIVQKGGLLLSEYTNGSHAYKLNFIERNRLVSGISDALLVTEAAIKSGTMHTVHFALQQGRPVFAVPGAITNPQSAGTNLLIQQGAQLVTSASDVMRALNIRPNPHKTTVRSDNPDEQAILDLLMQGVSDGGELLVKTQLSAARFAQSMTMLEIRGLIRPLGNNQWGVDSA